MYLNRNQIIALAMGLLFLFVLVLIHRKHARMAWERIDELEEENADQRETIQDLTNSAFEQRMQNIVARLEAMQKKATAQPAKEVKKPVKKAATA